MSGGGGWEVVKIIPVLIRLTRPSSANRGDRNTASKAEGRFRNNQAAELDLFAKIFSHNKFCITHKTKKVQVQDQQTLDIGKAASIAGLEHLDWFEKVGRNLIELISAIL